MGDMTNDELKAALMGDMEAEIDELVRERGSNGMMTLTEIEDMVLEAGRTADRSTRARAGAWRGDPGECSHGQADAGQGQKNKTVITRLGRISYQREYYYDAQARQGCSPLDDALGLTSQISVGVSKMLVKLSAHMPYHNHTAVQVYDELTHVRVSASTAWEKAQDAGQRARPALDPIASQKQTCPDATCVSIAMDGFMAHVREEGWKEVKIGTVAEIRASGRPQINQYGQRVEPMHAHAHSYVMHLGGPEGFGVRLAVEAHARQWSNVPHSVVIGDGATWIWEGFRKTV